MKETNRIKKKPVNFCCKLVKGKLNSSVRSQHFLVLLQIGMVENQRETEILV